MTNQKKILIIEDDANMGFLLKEFLTTSGFLVELATDGDAGLKAFLKNGADFCIIDVMLPGIDGFTLMERIRKEDPEIPVIFLTARSMKQDKIKGFNLGGDDYITKPFDEDELLCRINAILNRYQKNDFTESEPEISCNIGKYLFETQNQALTFENETQRLTYRECDVLRMLCSNKNNIVRRSDLLNAYWGRDDYFNGRSLDVFITRLRKRLANDPNVSIENIPKVGYVLKD
ncbi:response regulator transcription factor [Natronoflexus pectinivorans]|uniref:DNA-binding response OmpR family regulator n=1 Tax=Natronoflexus pectinivorans TaxID=682526 RepID=A0A4R2GLC6_9BACT|nr:response regulator transcription factor [Natronoflexus pectinivorans]TCO08291.1 DNA-binding response OmpR family regulator [Natronoflexus pectinivorans]